MNRDAIQSMDESVTIHDAIVRLEAGLERRPDLGRRRDRSVSTVTSGVRCITREGHWTIDTDLPGGLGGHAAAPTPSVLVRAALGSCLAAAAAGFTNVTFGQADAEFLDQEASFDVALCSLGLMYVPDPSNALAALLRSVRPGGQAVVSVWGERIKCGWASIFPVVDARVDSDVCPLFFALGAPRVLDETMARAGFVDVHSHRLDTILRYDNDDQALGAAFLGGPVALAYGRFDDRTRAEVQTEYLESISCYRDGAGYAVPGEFVIASGRRP
jgi:SAM-dependent methyltransferase